jgi:hypothetical protein
VLFKQRCPHTGVVNFFTSSEPLLAAGSIVKRAPLHYVWHCHLGDALSGEAADAALAEARLRQAIAQKTAVGRADLD